MQNSFLNYYFFTWNLPLTSSNSHFSGQTNVKFVCASR